MTLTQLRSSRDLWRRRRNRAVEKRDAAKKRGDEAGRKRWEAKRENAQRMVEKRLKQIAARSPRLITARQMNLRFQNLFGALGDERHVTGHHTAGPTNTSVAHGIALFRSYHNAHMAKGWGGEGYHYAILRGGEILCLRPTAQKGAHTGGWNSNNIGIAFPGTTGHKPTPEQRASYAWLLANAHTKKMPPEHRCDVDLRRATRRGHKEWPGHGSNACPGTHLQLIKEGR